jgi:hypothetical protein
MRKRYSTFLTTCLLFIIVQAVYSQKLPDLIHDLSGAKWIGHYQNSEDSILVHNLQWVVEYDGRIARAVKTVPELDFCMETTIYYDFEQDCFASLALLNKSMISKGVIEFQDNTLKNMGITYFQGGNSKFRIEYTLNNNGQLEDRFFRMVDGEWVQGHFILYKAVTIQPDH